MSETAPEQLRRPAPHRGPPADPLRALLQEAHLVGPHQVAALLTRHAVALGTAGAVAYLVDLQLVDLVPLTDPSGPEAAPEVLGVEESVAGGAFQHLEVRTEDLPGGGSQVWLPLLDGSERLGVLGFPLARGTEVDLDSLRAFASVAAELIVSRSLYGDTLVAARRRRVMGLAAEMQWSLWPPLTFASSEVTVAAALEPAYEVAGDTVDYAVDAGVTRVAILDGMGHGLLSAQLASLAVAAYRTARRAGRSLTDCARAVDTAVYAAYLGDAFTTAVLAELDTDDGVLTWISAGHPEPLLLRDGALLKSLGVDPGPPLGITGDAPGRSFAVGREQLHPGDRVVFYTDGVTEARTPEGDFFGVPRLVDLLVRHLGTGLPAPEAMRRIVRALLTHQRGRLDDDASLLMLQWRGGDERSLLP